MAGGARRACRSPGRAPSPSGLESPAAPVVTLALDAGLTAEVIHDLVDPTRASGPGAETAMTVEPAELETREGAAVALAKLARLLPAAVVAPVRLPRGVTLEGWLDKNDLMLVRARDILDYQTHAARTLTLVGDASVPLVDAENTRVLAFRPPDGGVEHLAIVIGAAVARERPGADPASFRMLHRRSAGLAAVRLRRPVAGRHRGDLPSGQRRRAVSGAGGQGHRAGQQAAGLSASGRRLRHRRSQRDAGLRRR